MADRALSLALEIVADNRAGEELKRFGDEYRQATELARRGSEGLRSETELTGRRIAEATRTARLFARSLLGEVHPALGQVVTASSLAARAVQGFGAVFTVASVGLAALTAAFAAYIGTLKETAAKQADFNLAVQRLDTGAIRGQLQALRREMEQLNELSRSGLVGAYLAQFQRGLREIGVLLGIARFPSEAAAERGAALGRLAPLEAAPRLGAARAERLQGELDILNTLQKQVAQQGDVNQLLAGREAILAKLQERQRQEAEALAASHTVERLRAEEGEIAAIRSRQAAESRALAAKQSAEQLSAVLGLQEQIRAASVEELQTIRQIILAQGQFTLGQSVQLTLGRESLENLNELIARKQAQGNAEKEVLLLLQLRQPLLEREAQLIGKQAEARQADIERQKVGADAATRAALDLEGIETRRQERLRAAALLQDRQRRETEEALIEAEAKTARTRAEFEEAARTDPLVGLRLGLQEVGDEFASLGELMRQGTRDLGQAMARSLSDTFFTVVTGEFKKLSELPRRFGEAVLRTFADLAARAAVGGSLQSLAHGLGLQAFLPGFGFFGFGGGNVPVTAALAAQLQAAGVPVGVSSTGQFAVQASTVQALQASGFLPNIPFPSFGVTSFLPSGAQTALATPLVLGPGVQAGLVGAEEAFAGASLVGTGGFNVGQALSAGFGAVGLGFTIFSALQGPPTPLNIAASAASGGISGALIGTAIAPGPGTVVGAIAGAILGGGAGAFGKGGGRRRRPSAQERGMAEGRAAAVALGNEVRTAQTPEQLVAALNQQRTSFAGGLKIIRARLNPGASYAPGDLGRMGAAGPWTGWAPIWDNSGFRPTSVSEILDPNIRWEVWAGALGVPAFHQDVTDALNEAIQRVLGSVAGAQIGFEELLNVPEAFGGGAVTRATLRSFPQVQAEGVPAGAQRVVLLEDSILGMSDDAKAALFQEIVRVAKDRDVVRVLIDPEARVPVTVGIVPAPA